MGTIASAELVNGITYKVGPWRWRRGLFCQDVAVTYKVGPWRQAIPEPSGAIKAGFRKLEHYPWKI